MVVPLTYDHQKRMVSNFEVFFKAPLPLQPSKVVLASKPNGRFQVRASMKEKVVLSLMVATLTISMMVLVVNEIAITPFLKNFLLNIATSGVVIVGVVIGADNFDLIKRN